MSYLGWPRLHFSGRFEADTSTVNNDVRHYKSDTFESKFQEPMVAKGSGPTFDIEEWNGYWNPEGSAAWRMHRCTVTGAAQAGKPAPNTPEIGLRLVNAHARVAGKLVDLDPQQQLVSEIWGLRIALEDGQGNRLLDSAYDVAAFIDLWQRQQNEENFDQTLTAVYQSTLSDLQWGDVSKYPLLQALKNGCSSGLLSIRFNVFGFDRDPTADDYMTGVIAGSIGPAAADEPKHFVLGRQLVAVTKPPGAPPMTPKNQIFGLQVYDHGAEKLLSADFGNSLPIQSSKGDFEDLGQLQLVVAKDPTIEQGKTYAEDTFALVGAIPYQDRGWYDRTAGVVDYDYAQDAWLVANLGTHPLAVVKASSTGYEVLVRETIDGLYLRADQFVHRLNPGQAVDVDVYVTRYGKPASAKLKADFDPFINIVGAGTSDPYLNKKGPDGKPIWPIPNVATPTSALQFDNPFEVDASGKATWTLTASKDGPGTPRHYLDGQIYGLELKFESPPAGYYYNGWNFLSILCFDHHHVPPEPTWYGDVQPIMQQYGNLYPIMSKHLVNLGDYDSVVKFREPLLMSFSLSPANPNYMPVSRDLSDNKRKTILAWLRSTSEGGLPPRGNPSEAPVLPEAPDGAFATAAPASTEASPNPGGKMDFLLQLKAAGEAWNGGGKQ